MGVSAKRRMGEWLNGRGGARLPNYLERFAGDLDFLRDVMGCVVVVAEPLPGRAIYARAETVEETRLVLIGLRAIGHALGHGSARATVRHAMSTKKTEVLCEPVSDVREPRPTKLFRRFAITPTTSPALAPAR